MAGGEAMYSAVLCQIVPPKSDKPYVPEYLNLEDKLHQLIFNEHFEGLAKVELFHTLILLTSHILVYLYFYF